MQYTINKAYSILTLLYHWCNYSYVVTSNDVWPALSRYQFKVLWFGEHKDKSLSFNWEILCFRKRFVCLPGKVQTLANLDNTYINWPTSLPADSNWTAGFGNMYLQLHTQGGQINNTHQKHSQLQEKFPARGLWWHTLSMVATLVS